MADEGGGSFLSRWSRRKAQTRAVEAGPETTPEAAAAGAPALPTGPEPLGAAEADASSKAADAAGVPDAGAAAPVAFEAGPDGAAAPRPTLEDVERLTPGADFSPFVDRLVQPEVRNAAMKKLFADPHFNVMDGLDVYIDDYNKTEPMPRQWLRQLVQARVLGLLDDEVEEQPRPDPDMPLPPSGDDVPEAAEAGEVEETTQGAQAAAAAIPPDTPRPHEDTDLPLQQDDAARHGGPRAAADDDGRAKPGG